MFVFVGKQAVSEGRGEGEGTRRGRDAIIVIVACGRTDKWVRTTRPRHHEVVPVVLSLPVRGSEDEVTGDDDNNVNGTCHGMSLVFAWRPVGVSSSSSKP